MDPADLRLGRPAAEAALARHLRALGTEPRPVLWCATPAEALRRAKRHPGGYRRAWRRGIRRTVPWYLRPLVRLAEARPNSPHTEYYDLQGGAEAAHDAALRAAAQAGPDEEAALRTALDRAQADALYDVAYAAVRSRLWDQVWRAAGLRGSGGLAVADRAAWAVIEENTRLIVDHPAQDRYADLWRPMVDAYAAGLCACWIGADEVLALPAPFLRLDRDGRLHRVDGPALLWPDGGDGEGYSFRDGTPTSRNALASARP